MQVDEFASLVRQFTSYVDRCATLRPHAVLLTCARLLSQIYAAALDLPDQELAVDPPDSKVVRPSFNFGRYDVYWEIHDPSVKEEAVAGLISDDLADVYVALLPPLLLFDAGSRQAATYLWRFAVKYSCGDDIVDSLRAIHRLIHDHMPDDFDPPGAQAG